MESLNFLNNKQILITRILPPDLPEGTVARPELLARLKQGVRNHRLTLLSAPAGSGKTTLVAQWINRNNFGNIKERVGWLTLDALINHDRSFWQYFLAACQRIWPETRFIAVEMLINGQPLPEILTVFLNELAALRGSG